MDYQFLPQGDHPNPGAEPLSPASPSLAGGFFTTGPPGKPQHTNSSLVFQNCFAGTVGFILFSVSPYTQQALNMCCCWFRLLLVTKSGRQMERTETLESGQSAIKCCLCPFWLCGSRQVLELSVPRAPWLKRKFTSDDDEESEITGAGVLWGAAHGGSRQEVQSLQRMLISGHLPYHLPKRVSARYC